MTKGQKVFFTIVLFALLVASVIAKIPLFFQVAYAVMYILVIFLLVPFVAKQFNKRLGIEDPKLLHDEIEDYLRDK